jgi:branched-chain amino acid transport system ATP-binding protein
MNRREFISNSANILRISAITALGIEVRDLEVAYSDYQVVWGVSLSVAAGESVALLGPNGSGKSTVVNTISGLLAAKAGEICFDGASLKGRPAHVRASLGIAHVLDADVFSRT